MAAGLSTIAAPDLANQHGGPDGLFRSPVGRVDRGVDQEPEPVRRMSQNMVGQATIRLEGEATGGYLFQLAGQRQSLLRLLVLGESSCAPFAAQGISIVDELQDLCRQARSAAASHFQQSFAPSLEVLQALLMEGLGKMVVHGPTIVDQRSAPIEPE